eukprot:5146201-Pyramimonas_sp.AAC.1
MGGPSSSRRSLRPGPRPPPRTRTCRTTAAAVVHVGVGGLQGAIRSGPRGRRFKGVNLKLGVFWRCGADIEGAYTWKAALSVVDVLFGLHRGIPNNPSIQAQ